MKTKTAIISILLVVISFTGFAQKNDVAEANKMIQEFKDKDPGINKFFSSSVGYAVFPGIGKGGLGVGGAGGKGTVFKGGAAGFELYLSSELETYSDKALKSYFGDVSKAEKEGRNLAEERYTKLFQQIGCSSIAEAEERARDEKEGINKTN